MSQTKLISLITLLLLVVIIVAQNAQVVAIRALFWKGELSLIVLLPLTLLTGFLAGFLAAQLRPRRP